MAKLLSEFEERPKEKSLLGEMLLAYGEIEFLMVRILAAFFDHREDTSARVLFRVRSEGQRLDVADAILRPEMDKLKLSGKWGNAIGAARHCKEIRNQYAHCHWWHDEERDLCFLSLDADAAKADGEMQVHFQPIDLKLIEQQHAYFQYTLDFLFFLDSEVRKMLGIETTHGFPEPKSIPQPRKSNPITSETPMLGDEKS
jgi:hypothetical protein